MVGRFFRKLMARPEAATPPTVLASVPQRHPPVAQAGIGGPLARRTEDAAHLKADIEHEAGASIEALHQAFAPDGKSNDALRLVESFQESMTGMIRQPPVAAQKALGLTRDPSTPVGKLVDLVAQDPTLGQALLRYANSAYYATSGAPCTSLPMAVQRVGMSGVHNVVLKSMLEVMLCRPGGSYQDLADKAWSHMVRTAPIARAIAPAFGVVPDEAFAIGLLHDAGKMVIFDRVGSLRTLLRRDLTIPYASLSAILRMLHEDFGALAALQWGLGVNVAHAVSTHHRAPLPEVRDALSEVLYLAERLDLLSQRGLPADLDALWRDGALGGDKARVAGLFDAPSDEYTLPALARKEPSSAVAIEA
ncbi:MAG: HDOD domain-containing protein [Gemmatimonadaceae bacterium]